MKVNEAFAKAFAPIPEGATCHLAGEEGQKGDTIIGACISIDGKSCRWATNMKMAPETEMTWRWHSYGNGDSVDTPDISDRPAESFRGFFGDAYDRVLDEALEPEDLPIIEGRVVLSTTMKATYVGEQPPIPMDEALESEPMTVKVVRESIFDFAREVFNVGREAGSEWKKFDATRAWEMTDQYVKVMTKLAQSIGGQSE